MADSNFNGVTGVKLVHGKKKIRMEKICAKSVLNKARTKGKDDTHVNKLTQHMRKMGILPHLPSPIVEEITPAIRREYKIQRNFTHLLHDGRHRHNAHDNLGMDSMVCDVVSCSSKRARRALQMKANVHPPALNGEVMDFVDYLNDMIREGNVANTQSAIANETESIASELTDSVKKQIVAETIKSNGAKIQWLNYTQKEAEEFLHDFHMTESGKWNAKTKRFGAVMTAGAEWRIVSRALKAYNTPDPLGRLHTPTDVVLKVYLNGDSGVMEKRRDVRDTANEILNLMAKTFDREDFPHGWPIRFVGYLPQDIGGGEDADSFYHINPDDELIDGA